MSAERLTFRRFVIETGDGEGTERFTEVAREGATVYVCTGKNQVTAKTEVRTFRSDDAAMASVDKRVATLRKNGYLGDGTIERERPEPDTTDRNALRTALYAKARAAFDEALPTFVTAWRAAGLDPALDFHAQCLLVKRRPTEVALQCLALAGGTFGVSYTRRTTAFDPEHGDVLSVPERLVAEFYQSPALVLALASEKLRGRSMRADDVDAPGLVDEISARLRSS